MKENQLPLHYTSPEADDLSNSVQITLAHFSAAGSASAALPVAVAPRALPGLHNQYVANDSERYTKMEEARASKLEPWLLAAAVISATTLFTTLYTICHPGWGPNFVAQTVKISKQVSADFKRKAITALGGTIVTDTAKAGAGTFAGAANIHDAPTGRNSASAVQPEGETAKDGVTRDSVVLGVRSAAPASLRAVARSETQHFGTSGGAHRTLASERDETGTRENSPRHAHNGFLVPPPPPTPCVLPPAFGFVTMQPSQEHAALQQELQQAQAQASPKTNNQSAARANTPQQSTAAFGRTEATQSAALVDADQELQAALSSSLRTVGEWTR